MDYKESSLILCSAYEKILDEKLWQRWLSESQNWDEKNWLGFDEYKDKLYKKATASLKSKEQRKADFEEAEKIAQLALKKLDPKNDIGKLPQKGGK